MVCIGCQSIDQLYKQRAREILVRRRRLARLRKERVAHQKRRFQLLKKRKNT